MPRNSANSKWLIPLFAGPELPNRANLNATLPSFVPAPPPWVLAGLVLWLDASADGSMHRDPDGRVHRWVDRSGNANDGLQLDASLRPAVSVSNPLAPRSVYLD